MYSPLRYTRENPPKKKDQVVIASGDFSGERGIVTAADPERETATVWVFGDNQLGPRTIPFSDLKPYFDVTPA